MEPNRFLEESMACDAAVESEEVARRKRAIEAMKIDEIRKKRHKDDIEKDKKRAKARKAKKLSKASKKRNRK